MNAANGERRQIMALKTPTQDQVAAAARSIGLSLSHEDLADLSSDIGGLVDFYYADLEALHSPATPTTLPDRPYAVPAEADNPLGAWHVTCSIRTRDTGPLAGRKIVLKDNICVAGLPLMNGSAMMQGYIADRDATVVTRLLDAGAEIIGKAHCEYLCASGGSNTNSAGYVLNPHDTSRTTGGSSSGCAALLAAGETDLALGGDQGGSIRAPACFCGVYGMKPTHGLVPYTGIFPIEPTLDHVGPMTCNTQDNARLLSVIAGKDGLDPRQSDHTADDYCAALDQGVKGLRIGVLQEGFGWPGEMSSVATAVRAAGDTLAAMGADVKPVSVPLHLKAMAIWVGVVVQGMTEHMMLGNGLGSGWKGDYPLALSEWHARWRDDPNALPMSVKQILVAGVVMRRAHGLHYYGMAQNLSRQLNAAYDRAFESCDLLLMPTTPMTAPLLPPLEGATKEQLNTPGFSSIPNTAPFDCTGHPAMNVPVGWHSGLPIGAMFVGRHFDEATIYRASNALEQAGLF